MRLLPLFRVVGLVFAAFAAMFAEAQNNSQPRTFPKYFLVASASEGDGFPTGPAKLCLTENRTICYETPSDKKPESFFGAHPIAQVLQAPATQWVMFSSECGGGSGWGIKVEILEYTADAKAAFRNLLPAIELPNLGEWAAWNIPDVSPYPVFLTAEYIWEGMQAHYAPHRYKINAYRYDPDAKVYKPVRSYETKRRYVSGNDDRVRVLEPQRNETLAHLTQLNTWRHK